MKQPQISTHANRGPVYLVAVHGDMHAAASGGDLGIHAIQRGQVLLQIFQELDGGAIWHVATILQRSHLVDRSSKTASLALTSWQHPKEPTISTDKHCTTTIISFCPKTIGMEDAV
jgi:hypothetical protein